MRARLIGATAAIALGLLPSRLHAQIARDSSVDWLVSAGSEGEQYLRVLQVAGLAPVTQWSIRPFSANVLRRIAPADSGHPWARQFVLRPSRRASLEFIQPEVVGILNTTYPYGYNDGPIWAGRGITTAVSAGVRGQYGPLSFVLAPQAFWAQNASFPLAPNGYSGDRRFADERYPNKIDLPQRFGAEPYSQLDPGQTVVALHLFNLAVGASTANEAWGPAIEEPFLLGNNAAGFGHLFAGTDGPVSLGPLRLTVRILAGRLEQSAYSPAAFKDRRRSIAGIATVVAIRQLPGLEVGAGRLFEDVYPDSGVSLGAILHPLWQGLLKAKLGNSNGGATGSTNNQLASAFARWVFPESGFEFYGELGREDHSYDSRDLLLEPDHDLAFSLGFERVWRRPNVDLLVLRGELLNSSVTHLSQVREEEPPYIHAPVLQGHTQRGQVLGAPGGYGGGAAMLAVEWISARGRKSVSWRRIREEPAIVGVRPVLSHALSIDWLMYRPGLDLRPEIATIYTANQQTRGSGLDVRFALTALAHW